MVRCKFCKSTEKNGVIFHHNFCKFRKGYGAAGDCTEEIGASGSGDIGGRGENWKLVDKPQTTLTPEKMKCTKKGKKVDKTVWVGVCSLCEAEFEISDGSALSPPNTGDGYIITAFTYTCSECKSGVVEFVRKVVEPFRKGETGGRGGSVHDMGGDWGWRGGGGPRPHGMGGDWGWRLNPDGTLTAVCVGAGGGPRPHGES